MSIETTAFQYSKFQEDIFDDVATGSGNRVIEARAGSAKTTTIIEAMKHITCGAVAPRVIFLAFNKHIATELQTKVPAFAVAQTCNSLGYQAFRGTYRGFTKVDANKTQNKLRYEILNHAFDSKDEKGIKTYYKVRNPISRLVGLAKAHMIPDSTQLSLVYQELADKYDIEIPELDPQNGLTFEALLAETYGLCLADRKRIDFDDQIFFPVILDLPVPQYDWVFIDEAQDWTLCQMELAKRLVAPGGRCIVVGDTHQAIYGFRGADTDAMAKWKTILNATELPLSICYRCAKSIIAEAQKIVPTIEPFEGQIEGEVVNADRVDYLAALKDGDYVLCRTTAPLVSDCLHLIRQGRKANIKGREIGANLIELIETICGANGLDKCDIPTFLKLLSEWEEKQIDKCRNNENKLVALTDKCETLRALAEDCNLVVTLKNTIEKIFSDSANDGVVFSTVHKAKGLEGDNVYIIRPDLMPHPRVKNDWQKVQEMNLRYVAITRAKRRLVYVQNQVD